MKAKRADGLQATVTPGTLVLERDGQERTESWPSDKELAERLRALGFKPEDLGDWT